MLHEYGIHTEQSDIRAHVSVVNRTVYVFETTKAVASIVALRPAIVTAKQPGCTEVTAEGWLMPIAAIDGIRKLAFQTWPRWGEFSPAMTTSQKGDLAVACVVRLLEIGRFPLWIAANESGDRSIQIAGTDILVTCNKRIQVKCDWRSGDQPKGTGNLFLQRAERNPFKRH